MSTWRQSHLFIFPNIQNKGTPNGAPFISFTAFASTIPNSRRGQLFPAMMVHTTYSPIENP